MKIILIRHATTVSNREATFSGPDTMLWMDAQKQTAGVKERLVQRKIDLVYASPLLRTRETARLCGFPSPITDERLRERSFGIFEELTREQCSEKYPESFENFQNNPLFYKIPLGESFDQVCERVWDFLEEITEEERQGPNRIVGHRAVPNRSTTVVVFAHYYVIQAAIAWVLETQEHVESIHIENVASVTLEIKGNRKYLVWERDSI